MALPVFRAAGAKTTGGPAEITIAAPAGVATGDLEILLGNSRGTSSLTLSRDGWCAWTVLTGSPLPISGVKFYIWWRGRQAGDSDAGLTAGSGSIIGARLADQAGTFDTGTPVEIIATGSEATSDTSFSFAPGT